jgi:hypothetical protein
LNEIFRQSDKFLKLFYENSFCIDLSSSESAGDDNDGAEGSWGIELQRASVFDNPDFNQETVDDQIASSNDHFNTFSVTDEYID